VAERRAIVEGRRQSAGEGRIEYVAEAVAVGRLLSVTHGEIERDARHQLGPATQGERADPRPVVLASRGRDVEAVGGAQAVGDGQMRVVVAACRAHGEIAGAE